jgi:MazG family protein
VAERGAGDLVEAVRRLDEITRRLRRECPWDREQDERSIVPHTVEEAYELADAAHAGDDAKLLDELGDVLFQVVFLSLLLEERGAGSLAAVADHCREKLIRRHPHVFGEAEAESAADVLRSWSRIKREDERGGDLFGELPETLPSTTYAKKLQRRAESAGHDGGDAREALERVRAAAAERDVDFDLIGRLLFDAVDAGRLLGVDAEVALRERANRFRRDIEQAGSER